MVVFGEQCSLTERRADEATRDVVSWLKCEYLRDQVGAVFAGHVSAVTGFGLFVELKDLYVEGLVHITALPHDYYRFEAAQHRLVGERTRRVFGLGDELVVRVVRVDLENRKIDFELDSDNAVRRPQKSIVPLAVKKAEKKKAKAAEHEKPGKNSSTKKSAKNTSETAAAKPSNGKQSRSPRQADAGKTSAPKKVTAKGAAGKSQLKAESPSQTKAAKVAAAKRAAEAIAAPINKVPSEADHGDQDKKTARETTSPAVREPAPSKASSLFAKTKAAVKKALGKSESKD